MSLLQLQLTQVPQVSQVTLPQLHVTQVTLPQLQLIVG